MRRAGSCHCNQMLFEGAKDAQEALTAPSISMMDGTCELCRMGEKESRHSPMAHSSPRWDAQTSTFLEDALLVSTGQAALCPPSRNLSNPVHISCTWTLPIQSSPIRELPNTRDVVPKKALQRHALHFNRQHSPEQRLQVLPTYPTGHIVHPSPFNPCMSCNSLPSPLSSPLPTLILCNSKSPVPSLEEGRAPPLGFTQTPREKREQIRPDGITHTHTTPALGRLSKQD